MMSYFSGNLEDKITITIYTQNRPGTVACVILVYKGVALCSGLLWIEIESDADVIRII